MQIFFCHSGHSWKFNRDGRGPGKGIAGSHSSYMKYFDIQNQLK